MSSQGLQDRYGRSASCPGRSFGLCYAINAETAAELQRTGSLMQLPEGQQIALQDGGLRIFSIIISGVAKLVASRANGERQIVGLQFQSDFIGRPFGDVSNLSIKAATDLELCAFSGTAFESLIETHPDLERALLARVLKDLDVARDWLFLLGRKAAEEKVAAFLIMLHERMQPVIGDADPNGSCNLRLPLSRSEIAECLNLRLETVSRQFSLLKSRGLIGTSGRRDIVILDMPGLKRYLDSASDTQV